MGISLNNDITSIMNKLNASESSSAKSSALSSKLSNLEHATEAELMEACKSFEAYLIETVLQRTKEAIVPKDEDDENEYMRMFGDKLYEGYAKTIAESGQLGIAQKLFEAMKRDYGLAKTGAEVSAASAADSAGDQKEV